MAKIGKNANMLGLSGGIGNLVFRQMPDGSTRVSQKPDFSRRKFSQEQKDHQQRFREAAAYARWAAGTQPLYTELARGTTKTAYNVALSDWFHPPVIHHIEWKDGLVRVQASDNVMVTKVEVRVVNGNGEVVEAGEASQIDPMWWEFPSTAEGAVEAVAWDLAQNKTKVVL